MKWPSANEVDFGEFIVAFDYKQGTASIRYLDGAEYLLATFQPQKQTRAASEISGDIQIRSSAHTLQLACPLVSEDGSVQLSISVDTAEELKLEGSIITAIRCRDAFTITPIIAGREVYLAVDYEEESQDLATFVASLLVFSRFSAQAEDRVLEE